MHVCMHVCVYVCRYVFNRVCVCVCCACVFVYEGAMGRRLTHPERVGGT
jgi:hypothetical protein